MAKIFFRNFIIDAQQDNFMRIDSVHSYKITKSSQNNTNFKQGLTPTQINRVKSLGIFDYKNITERLYNAYGIEANVGQSNTVAYCADLTAKIMRNAGFKLPKYFSFTPFSCEHKGRYTYNDEVLINSNYEDYLDLESQNIFAENLGCGAICKHFLETYLHEFSHCAHLKNLIALLGNDQANKVYWVTLSLLSPQKIIANPINMLIEKLFPDRKEELTYNVFEQKENIFTSQDLVEYFAERNADNLANELGNDCVIGDIDSEFAYKYKGFPEDFKFDKTKIEEPIKYFKDCIKYFDGEIWNGNVYKIMFAHLSLRSM